MAWWSTCFSPHPVWPAASLALSQGRGRCDCVAAGEGLRLRAHWI
jgi:hypothetical protein